MIRRSLKTALVLAAAFAAMVGGANGASADTWNDGSSAAVTVNTATGVGEAMVIWTGSALEKTDPAYAAAVIDNDTSGYSLKGWLERSHNGGAFERVSSVHYLNDGNGENYVQTYGYYDGPGYMARACFQFTSWSGAAVHCSPAI
ncbi:hypothetical protein [Streptomyces sp. cg40]|uniref:hypothetical protein n=1 Tax=Streptomyces sp. cg40 TaxID=3419764 RepID=UPI003D059FC7